MSYITMSNMVAHQAAWNLNAVSASLGESILQLSTGLRVNTPQDDIVSFLKGSSLTSDIKEYTNQNSALGEYQAIFQLGSSAATQITSDLQSMQQLATQGTDPTLTAPQRTALFTQYNSLRTNISNIVLGTKYQGGGILNAAGQYNQPLTISVTPDRSVTMSVDLNPLDVSVAGPTGIILSNVAWANAAAAAASATQVATAMDTVNTVQSQITGALDQLDGYVTMTTNTIQNYTAAKSSLLDTNVADEMATYTALDVQKQAATSMLAQANFSQRGLLDLYKFQFS